jgi:hypothetical protein
MKSIPVINTSISWRARASYRDVGVFLDEKI